MWFGGLGGPSWAWCLLLTLAVSSALAEEDTRVSILPTSPTQTKSVGRSALFTCQVSGAQAALVTDMRWSAPDGRQVAMAQPGAPRPPAAYAEHLSNPSSLGLIIPSLTFNDAGNYTCSATAPDGRLLSHQVTIKVIQSITFEDAPVEQFPLQGQRYLVRCRVVAMPSATVDWLKDGAPPGERYVSQTDGLLIPTAGAQDDGTYTCRAIVVSTGELQVRNIRVEVQVPPSFAENATRQVTATAGSDASLHCQAEGRPPPEYTWLHTATSRDLAEAGGRFQVDPLTGTLQITPVKEEDRGSLSCKATNRAGHKTHVVHLQVLVPPQIINVVNTSAPERSLGRLICRARGNPPPVITWRRVGSDVPFSLQVQSTDTRITTSYSKSTNPEKTDRAVGNITISTLERSDDGLYTCLADNEAGHAESNAHLTVEFAPTFESTPHTKLWSWDGHAINISCLAVSIPNATISWDYNARDIEKPHPDPFFQKFGKGPSSYLLVTPSLNKGYGTYTCKARNIHGDTKYDIELHKAERPGPLMQASPVKVTATTMKFQLVGQSKVGGIGILAYTVRYREKDANEWRNHTWPAESAYILEGLTPQTHYTFEFAASNEVGLGVWSAKQTYVTPKRAPPEPPIVLTTSQDQPLLSPYPNFFEMRWQIPEDNGEPLLDYSIKMCMGREQNGKWEIDSSGSCRTNEITASDQSTSYRLQNLTPATVYYVEVKARNSIGTSQPGVLLLRTAPDPSKGTYEGSNGATQTRAATAAITATVLLAWVSAFFPSPSH